MVSSDEDTKYGATPPAERSAMKLLFSNKPARSSSKATETKKKSGKGGGGKVCVSAET